MKQLLIIMLVATISTALNAQKDFVKNLEGINWVKISSKSNIILRTHNKNQLIIKYVSGNDSIGLDSIQGLRKKIEGLRLVSTALDNTSMGYNVTKEGNDLVIINVSKENGYIGNTEIYLPSSKNISLKNIMFGNIEIFDFKGEIEASTKMGNISIEGATGSIIANSESGDINVVFSKVTQSLPISISSVVGHVDVSIPSSTSANLTLKSLIGEIYTDFKINLSGEDCLDVMPRKKIQTSINNGGVTIRLGTASGNIYLRKL